MVGCKKYTCCFYIVIAYIFVCNESCAQNYWQLSREAIDSLVYPKVMELGKEILTFNTTTIHLGSVNESDKPRIVTFYFRNSSNDSIRITNIKTSCSCTQVQLSKSFFLQGERGNIKLTFDPQNQGGTIDSYAYIYTNLSDSNPIARLRLTGNVLTFDEPWNHLPQKMGALRLKRKEITFKERESGDRSSLIILCGNSGDKPLKLEAINLPSFLEFKTIPSCIESNCEGDLIFTLKWDKLPEELMNNSSNEIVLQGIDDSQQERTIKININIE